MRAFYIPEGQQNAAARIRIANEISRLPPGRAYDVEIREHKPRRSDEQNRYLWGVVYPAILANAGGALDGWDSEDLHEYCLGEFFGWERLDGLGRAKVRPIRRSSRLNKQEFSNFLEFICRRMAQHGIVIPQVEDPWVYESSTAS
jgi:hypothetical protein